MSYRGTAAEEQHIIQTFATHTAREQAEALGVCYERVVRLRGRLAREGKIDFRQRCHRRPWSTDEDNLLCDMIQEGKSLRAIARKLGRTETAVLIRAKREHGGMTWLKNAWFAPMTLRDVARLFGLSCSKRAAWWIQQGWLRGTRHGRRRGYTWRVSQGAILDFLVVREVWMAWDPALMTDPDLRAEAVRLRAEAGGHWIKLATWAKDRGFSVKTGYKWVGAGLLSGVKYNNHWYIWSADLERFVPPSCLEV